MKRFCAICSWSGEITEAALKIVAQAGLPHPCPQCGSETWVFKASTGRTDNQKRSREQEKRVAAREGAKCQPASGSRSGYEDDVRKVGSFRGECKLTRAASYKLNLKDLTNLESHARGGELPALDIEFQGVNPPRRYVVLPEWVYETLMMESGRREHADTDASRA